jgi:hypothetical protein
MDVKQAAAFDDEAHFVFVVPVLAAESGEHGFTSITSAVT